MFLLAVLLKNRNVEYVGPFPTYFLANEFGKAFREEIKEYKTHHVCALQVPDVVVKQVVWK